MSFLFKKISDNLNIYNSRIVRSKQKPKTDINNNSNDKPDAPKKPKKMTPNTQLSVNSSPSSCTPSSFSSSSNSSAESSQVFSFPNGSLNLPTINEQYQQSSSPNNEAQFDLNDPKSLLYTQLIQSPSGNISNRTTNSLSQPSNRINTESNLIQYYAQINPEQAQSPHHLFNNHLIQYNQENNEDSNEEHHQHYMHLHHHNSLQHLHPHHAKRSKIESENEPNTSILQYQLSKTLPSNSNQMLQHQYYDLINNPEQENNQQNIQIPISSSTQQSQTNYLNHLQIIGEQNYNQNESNGFAFNNVENNTNNLENSVRYFLNFFQVILFY